MRRRFPFAGLAPLLLACVAYCQPAVAAPSCAEGPQIVGDEYIGTPCDDTIRAPRGVTVLRGEGGNDVLFGQRGNDRLFGGPGDDRLYGGIGDDQLRGGPGDDLLSGGFGADSALDGEAGDDLVRGDATIDAIQNTGGGVDTLSYATGVTPGFFNRSGAPYFFPDFSVYDEFPGSVDGRGAYVDLGTGRGDNGRAPHGGGFDENVAGAEFEVVIGSAFPDYIVGTSQSQTIYGGGGADVIIGGGGTDEIHGGAEGDYCAAAAGSALSECEFGGGDTEVDPRDPGAIAVGSMAPGSSGPAAPYLTGSDEVDEVTASYGGGTVAFSLGPGSDGGFDPALAGSAGCGPPSAGTVVCPVAGPPDSVLIAGLGEDDVLRATGFPATTSVVALGGAGDDEIEGGATEDALVDGDGSDVVSAGAGDDAVPNNEGTDDLDAGSGEDLFISDSVCEGDVLDGGADRDNANWANFDFAISIDMGANAAGEVGPSGQPACGGNPLTTLRALEDIEGTSFADIMVGDSGPNQLLGRLGADTYVAGAGDDSILANSGTPVDDPDASIDCGDGFDTAQIDFPENGPDPAPLGCESVQERAPNSFRPPDTPPDPNPPVEPEVTPPPVQKQLRPARDRTPPQTRILHRPRRLTFAASPSRRVTFSFTSNEPGSRFRCKLDRRPLRPCRSPRAYLVAAGPHRFLVFAIDAAGNRDRTPARLRFQIRRR